MGLRDRIHNPDRRIAEQPPQPTEQPEPPRRVMSPWVRRAQSGALYGFDACGRPVAGKSMDGRAS